MQTCCDCLSSRMAPFHGPVRGSWQVYPSRQSEPEVQFSMQKLRPVRDGDW